jgi:2TM family of unknown function (DUF5676)
MAVTAAGTTSVARADPGRAADTSIDAHGEGEALTHPLSWKVMAWSLGLFAAVSFVLCVLYGLVVPKTLHMVQFLEITLPGFRWLSPGSFVLGLVESFLYGVYAGLVFTPIHNFIACRCG